MIDLPPQGLLLVQRNTKVQFTHDVARQHAQNLALMTRQGARLLVENAERSQRKAICPFQDRARIEAKACIAHAKGIIGHPLIVERIWNFEVIALQNGMAAKAGLKRGRPYAQPDLSLEPLPSFIDEIDDGHRGFADFRRYLDQFVELSFPICIKYPISTKFAQAFVF